MPDQPSEDIRFLHNAEMGLGAQAWGDRILWNYGRGFTDADIQAGFHASLQAGVNLVDTAEIYGQGRSERLIGQFLKTAGRPVVVATKFFPFPWRLKKQALLHALRHSLERLGLERVDLYQIHWPFPPLPVESWVESLAEAVNIGLTRAAGVSNYDRIQLQRAYTVLSRYNIPLASNQVEYHLLDRKVEKNGLLAHCQELGVRLIAYSPLAKGLLTGKYTSENPPPSIRWRGASALLKKMGPMFGLMAEIGRDQNGKTPAQISLNWIICKGGMPIPGAKNAEQAAQNVGAIGWRLTPEQVKALDDASNKIIP